MSRALWNTFKKKFPELRKYQLLALDPTPLNKLLAWVPKGKTVSVYDRRCRRIKIKRDRRALIGRRVTSRTISGRAMTISHAGYTFSNRILLTDGGTDSYRRIGKKWVKTGGGAHGCASHVGRVLSRVTASAAYYDASLVALYTACSANRMLEQHCIRGSKRTCRWCGAWSIRVRSLMGRVGYGYGPQVVTGVPRFGKPKPVDCRKPCPGKAKPQAVKDLDRFLKGQQFLYRDSPQHPYIFRSRKACLRYRKRKKISKDDLNVSKRACTT